MTGGTSPTVFLVAFVVYIAVMIFIGWYSSRGKSEGTDYLTGGRGLNLLMIFGTIGATMIGTGSSMGAISNGFRSGWGGSTYGLGCSPACVRRTSSRCRKKHSIILTAAAPCASSRAS